MAAKKTGLAAFTSSRETSHEGQDEGIATLRTRAKGDVVQMTVRLTREQWERVNQLADTEGISFNQLALHAISKLFEARGLPKL
jgi:predicted HicB family RNase H-like nuclease